MKNLKKKGFTIVELVIVIAVIAILAAVLIPTFVNLTKKANQSADMQAVRQMNTVLAANEVLEGKSIFELYNALEEAGMSGEDYKPLTKDTMFFWDSNLNRVLHVESNMKVLAPKEYENKTYNADTDTWISLSMDLFEENVKAPTISEGYTDYKVSGYNASDVNVKVTSAGELAFVFDYLNEEIKKNPDVMPSSYTIDLGGNVVDMMGSNLCLNEFSAGKGCSTTFSIINGTIKNASMIDPTSLGDGQTEGHTGQYATGLIGKVTGEGETSVIIENMTFDSIHVNNSHISQAGILIGFAGPTGTGTITINNVKIKNSSLLAHRSAGALIGNVALGDTKVNLNNITMENVDVKTVGGRSAMLIGYFQPTITDANFKVSGIKLTNCSFSIYECAQNTGISPVDNATILSCPKEEGYINSWAFKSDGIAKENCINKYKYIPNTLMLLTGQISGDSHFDGKVTGWNK